VGGATLFRSCVGQPYRNLLLDFQERKRECREEDRPPWGASYKQTSVSGSIKTRSSYHLGG